MKEGTGTDAWCKSKLAATGSSKAKGSRKSGGSRALAAAVVVTRPP